MEAMTKRGFLPGKANEVDDPEADGKWRKTDMVLLGKLATELYTKKIDELAEVDRHKRMTVDRDKMITGSIENSGLLSDAYAEEIIQFCQIWNAQWAGNYGSFHDITIIDPMRFTYDPPPPCARPCSTLQVFSVKVESIKGDLQLQWPLDVFGMVAVRDSVDRNRNILFSRSRDNCQTLTEKDQCLVMSGPSRAVVLSNNVSDPVIVEVELKVKGINEYKDEDLSLLAKPLTCSNPWDGTSNCSVELFPSKRSVILFTLGHIPSSVEATIFIRVVDGSWPRGFHGEFAARTSIIDFEKVILLDFGDNDVPISDDGIMKMSRHVVSVEVDGKLKVSFKASQDDSKAVTGEVKFKPARAGRSYGTLDFVSCKMEVIVAWSLISPEPEPDY